MQFSSMFNVTTESEPQKKKFKQLSILDLFASGLNKKPHNECGNSGKPSTHKNTKKKNSVVSRLQQKRQASKRPLEFVNRSNNASAPAYVESATMTSTSEPSGITNNETNMEPMSSKPSALLEALDVEEQSNNTVISNSASDWSTTNIQMEEIPIQKSDLEESYGKCDNEQRSRVDCDEKLDESDTLQSESYNESPLLFESQSSQENVEEPTPQSSCSPTPPCLGMPFNDLKTTPSCSRELPTLRCSNEHTVLFDESYSGCGPPAPRFAHYNDKWDNHHVRLPCSPKNLYPVITGGNQETLASRWEFIESTLLMDITSSIDLEESILTYNSRYANRWNFRALHIFFTEVASPQYTSRFFTKTLPAMIRLALSLPRLCTQPIPLLQRQQCHKITMTQEQIACLLCNAFFCTYPRRNSQQRNAEYANYPEINFNRLFQGRANTSDNRYLSEKLRTLFHYFDRVTTEMPTGTVTFERRCIDEFPRWNQSPCTLCGLHLHNEGRIEKEGHGMLQMDFANKYIGGGVLGCGLVQEEIRFCVSPELIVSKLFTEKMDDNECVIITGAEQYSMYTGYANTYKWDGDYIDTTPVDEWRRKYTQVVAVDAIHFKRKLDQYSPSNVRRELNKAYCGFYCDNDPDHSPAIATGNWGCGAFGGNPMLKGLLQLMAAASLGRDTCYFTFNDAKLMTEFHDMYSFIKEKDLKLRDLWHTIVKYNELVKRLSDEKTIESLFDFMQRLHSEYNQSTDDEDA